MSAVARRGGAGRGVAGRAQEPATSLLSTKRTAMDSERTWPGNPLTTAPLLLRCAGRRLTAVESCCRGEAPIGSALRV